jgi:hypothetical protein
MGAIVKCCPDSPANTQILGYHSWNFRKDFLIRAVLNSMFYDTVVALTEGLIPASTGSLVNFSTGRV